MRPISLVAIPTQKSTPADPAVSYDLKANFNTANIVQLPPQSKMMLDKALLRPYKQGGGDFMVALGQNDTFFYGITSTGYLARIRPAVYTIDELVDALTLAASGVASTAALGTTLAGLNATVRLNTSAKVEVDTALFDLDTMELDTWKVEGANPTAIGTDSVTAAIGTQLSTAGLAINLANVSHDISGTVDAVGNFDWFVYTGNGKALMYTFGISDNAGSRTWFIADAAQGPEWIQPAADGDGFKISYRSGNVTLEIVGGTTKSFTLPLVQPLLPNTTWLQQIKFDEVTELSNLKSHNSLATTATTSYVNWVNIELADILGFASLTYTGASGDPSEIIAEDKPVSNNGIGPVLVCVNIPTILTPVFGPKRDQKFSVLEVLYGLVNFQDFVYDAPKIAMVDLDNATSFPLSSLTLTFIEQTTGAPLGFVEPPAVKLLVA